MTLLDDTRNQDAFAELATTQQQLLAWFVQHGRNLPWRHTRDPYRILVAEMMLQQTQVDRVVPKYRAFLESFPTVEALASAPTAEVIRAWAGLGYNRRAVNMQRTARAVLEQHGGAFPRDPAALRRLPGIGPYTAGAIACFAFEQDVAFMDTNIRRVIQRLFVGPPGAGDARLLAIAQAAIPAGQGWAWNQAIMELGALICTAATPACWRCPLQAGCKDYMARRSADEHLFQALTVGEAMPHRKRRVAERRETPYTGSNRFYRGRVVEALRQIPAGVYLTFDQLGQQIKEDFSDADRPWLHALVAGLERDGLIVLEGEAARLP